MKKLLSLGAVAMLAFAACATPAASTNPAASTGAGSSAAAGGGSGGLIGIAMPTKSSQRWVADGDNLVKSLTALGYTTDLEYAEDKIPTQVSQVENMITKGAKLLIIAAIDGTTLTDTLQKAADAKIKVLLRPADQQVPERGLLHDLRQLQGRRPPGGLDRRLPRPQGRQGPVQHRAVRRLAG